MCFSGCLNVYIPLLRIKMQITTTIFYLNLQFRILSILIYSTKKKILAFQKWYKTQSLLKKFIYDFVVAIFIKKKKNPH